MRRGVITCLITCIGLALSCSTTDPKFQAHEGDAANSPSPKDQSNPSANAPAPKTTSPKTTTLEIPTREQTEEIFDEILAFADNDLSVLVNESEGVTIKLDDKFSFQFAGGRGGYLTVLHLDADPPSYMGAQNRRVTLKISF